MNKTDLARMDLMGDFNRFFDEINCIYTGEGQSRVLSQGKASDKEIHEKMCTEIHHMFTEKNKRYGNSFSEQFEEFGILSLIIRLNDKMNRLKTLTKDPSIGVLDESIEDSLKDLANYAIMGLVELHKKERGVK